MPRHFVLYECGFQAAVYALALISSLCGPPADQATAEPRAVARLALAKGDVARGAVDMVEGQPGAALELAEQAGAALQAQDPDDRIPGRDWPITFTLERVRDADTFVGTVHQAWGEAREHVAIRAADYDAWEVSRRRTSVVITNEEIAQGHRAKQEAETLLKAAQKIYLVPRGTDRYGRPLAIVWRVTTDGQTWHWRRVGNDAAEMGWERATRHKAAAMGPKWGGCPRRANGPGGAACTKNANWE